MLGQRAIFQTGKKPTWGALALCVTLGLTFLGGHANAADPEPFQMDTAHWMSFDHYKDATQRGALETPPTPPENTSVPAAPDQNQDAETVSSSGTPVIAAPSRPIDLPVMPGMNKGFTVKITSTEDDHLQQMSVPVIDDKIAPDIHLPDKNWQAPITAHARKDGSEDDVPLDVRLSYLPNTSVTPASSTQHQSVMPADHAIAEQRAQIKKLVVENQKTAAAKANCDTIDALKKQQLEAIQSDRQTLKALQDAIASLGLQKQLDFMANGAGSLNASAPQAGSANTATPTSVR